MTEAQEQLLLDVNTKVSELVGVLVGVKGSNGLVERVANIDKATDEINKQLPNLITYKTCHKIRKEESEKREKKAVTKRTIGTKKKSDMKYIITTVIAIVSLIIVIVKSF